MALFSPKSLFCRYCLTHPFKRSFYDLRICHFLSSKPPPHDFHIQPRIVLIPLFTLNQARRTPSQVLNHPQTLRSSLYLPRSKVHLRLCRQGSPLVSISYKPSFVLSIGFGGNMRVSAFKAYCLCCCGGFCCFVYVSNTGLENVLHVM